MCTAHILLSFCTAGRAIQLPIAILPLAKHAEVDDDLPDGPLYLPLGSILCQYVREIGLSLSQARLISRN